MSHVHHSVELPYGALQLFNLAADVQSYPQFVPFCTKGEVQLCLPPHSVRASLYFSKGPFKTCFTTLNHLLPGVSIKMELLEGPFSALEGGWYFTPLPTGCLVTFDLQFAFSHRWMTAAMSGLLDRLALQMVQAFTSRAHALYRPAAL